MKRRTFFRVAGGLFATGFMAPDLAANPSGRRSPSPRSVSVREPVPDAGDWETVSALLENASSVCTEPWDDATCRTLMKGGYLGNGDLGVHLGGTRHSLVYYLGKNGFHAGNDVTGFRSGDDPAPGPYKQHILTLARLTLESAAGSQPKDDPKAPYRVEQDLKNAEIRTETLLAGEPVRTRAFLDPSGNACVLEMSAQGGKDVRLRATLSVIGNAHVALSAGAVGTAAWVTK
ncbi:MAG: hypothetical protein ACKOKG_09850, partial [Verrucomicrobiota bacterium]